MTAISIPVPASPIGTVDENGRIVMAREWYRFFGLLQKGVGGDTTTIVDIVDNTFSQPSPEQIISESPLLVANGASITAALLGDLLARIAVLEAQMFGRAEPAAMDAPLSGREEFPYRALDDLQLLQRPT